MEKAHVMRVPAGATIYFVNRDKNEKLVVYVLVKSIDAPGQAQVIIVILKIIVHQNFLKIKVQNLLPQYY